MPFAGENLYLDDDVEEPVYADDPIQYYRPKTGPPPSTPLPTARYPSRSDWNLARFRRPSGWGKLSSLGEVTAEQKYATLGGSRKRRSIRRKASSKKRTRARRRAKSTTSKRGSCHIGYVQSKVTGRCVYATGSKGRKLSKRRAAVRRSHKREGRPSPNVSATLFPAGHVVRGSDGFLWKIKLSSKGVKRWVKVRS